MCCELLSNFLYFCSRNNSYRLTLQIYSVVNCSQIFCTFAVETTFVWFLCFHITLWIALKFFVLLQSKQHFLQYKPEIRVVNCSQIFCTFAVETTKIILFSIRVSCELLSNFLYFCSRNNFAFTEFQWIRVVNCSQIFCTFAVETTQSVVFECVHCCELLSNFLYFCSRNNWVIAM